MKKKCQQPKMDDLLREIKKLSAKMKDGNSEDSNSSKESTVTSQPASAKKIAKKRQKHRNKKHRGRKRQLKYIPDLEFDSSSFTDCTDEEIIRDYIENITANLSDSDVDATLKNGAFLVKQDFSSTHDFRMPWSPEVDETDSFNESFRLTQSRKKRRKYKRHSIDEIDQPIEHVTSAQQVQIQNVFRQQYSRSSCKAVNRKKLKLEKNNVNDELEGNGEDSQEMATSRDSSQANSSSENSESSSNTNSPGSEADDEGEESCLESGVKPVIPWWEQQNDSDMSVTESDQVDGIIRQSLSLMRNRPDFKTRLSKTNAVSVLCESGGFVAYVNHKIRNFVQHRDSNELSLYTSNIKEQNQVSQLALLYNLQCLIEEAGRGNKVALTKTRNTADADQEALKLFLSREVKLRCRKNRPAPSWNSKRRKVALQSLSESNVLGFSNEIMDVPIPDSNVGNQMLRTMGWKPGQGLGKDRDGILNPLKATKRPRHLGFGHPGVT